MNSRISGVVSDAVRAFRRPLVRTALLTGIVVLTGAAAARYAVADIRHDREQQIKEALRGMHDELRAAADAGVPYPDERLARIAAAGEQSARVLDAWETFPLGLAWLGARFPLPASYDAPIQAAYLHTRETLRAVRWWRAFQRATAQLVAYDVSLDLRDIDAAGDRSELIRRMYLAKAGLERLRDGLNAAVAYAPEPGAVQELRAATDGVLATTVAVIRAADQRAYPEAATAQAAYVAGIRALQAQVDALVGRALATDSLQAAAARSERVLPPILELKR